MATAERLPHGPHRLTREEVESSQRGRMLWAMIEAVSESGFAGTPVAEVLRRARVSRETFYDNFDNREDCFLAAYEVAVQLVMVSMEEAGSSGATGRERLALMLERYLGTLASVPDAARTFMVGVYGAGDAALVRRNEVQERFGNQVGEWLGASTAEQRFACELVVAAVIGLVTQWICAGRTADLPQLHQPLMAHLEPLLSHHGLDAG